MMTTTLLLVALLAQDPAPSAPAAPAVPVVPFGPGVTLYIDEMDGDLDGFLRAELMKKKVPVSLVMDAEAASFVMIGASSERKSAWHEGWLTGTKDKATGAVTILSKQKAIVWAEEAGDRSMWLGNLSRGGPRKVASRIADRLKDHLNKQAR